MAIILVALWWFQRRKKKVEMDERTSKMLTTPETVEKECAPIVNALTSASVVSDESQVIF